MLESNYLGLSLTFTKLLFQKLRLFEFSAIKLLSLVLLSVLYFGLNGATAQEANRIQIVDDPSLAEGEIIADREENRDANGRLAAGLLIKSDLTGLRFQSNNGIIKVRQNPGEWLLYLSPDERKVTIYREQFTPKEIILTEEGINLQSGRVWEMEVTSNQTLQALPVEFEITPEEAELFVDEEERDIASDIELTPGEHVVRIQQEEYDQIIDTISVAEDKVNSFNYTLKEVEPVQLYVETEPSDALLRIDGQSIGRTPQNFFQFPGSYELELIKEGYVDLSEQIVIEGDKERDTLSYQLQENVGYLALSLQPSDVSIQIDGESKKGPANYELTPGAHQIKIEKKFYETYLETIEIEQGKQDSLNVELNRPTGNLQVSVKPGDANFKLYQGDNTKGKIIEEWKGLKFISDLPAGNYTLYAQYPNFSDKKRTVIVKGNETREVEISLDPKEGVKTGGLIVEVEPTEADVEVEDETGKVIRQHSLQKYHTFDNLSIGEYTIKAKHDEFFSTDTTVEIERGFNTEVNFNLTPIPDPKAYNNWKDIQNTTNNRAWTFSIFGGLAAGAGYYANHRSNEYHTQYNEAIDPNEISNLWDKTVLWNDISNYSYIGASTFGGLALYHIVRNRYFGYKLIGQRKKAYGPAYVYSKKANKTSSLAWTYGIFGGLTAGLGYYSNSQSDEYLNISDRQFLWEDIGEYSYKTAAAFGGLTVFQIMKNIYYNIRLNNHKKQAVISERDKSQLTYEVTPTDITLKVHF